MTLIQNPVLIIWGMVTVLLEKIMALGGVAVGSIKAEEAAKESIWTEVTNYYAVHGAVRMDLFYNQRL